MTRADRSPLRDWGDELRQRRRQRRRQRVRAASAGLGLGLILASIALPPPTPRLVWNASASAPVGLYLVTPIGGLRHDEMVVSRLAPAVARFAATRHYLPLGVPVVKHVEALPGETICGDGAVLRINGAIVAHRLSADGERRPLPLWEGCRTLGPDQLFLLNGAAPHSFDGRYVGPSDRHDLIGEAVPLWLR